MSNNKNESAEEAERRYINSQKAAQQITQCGLRFLRQRNGLPIFQPLYRVGNECSFRTNSRGRKGDKIIAVVSRQKLRHDLSLHIKRDAVKSISFSYITVRDRASC